MMVRTSRKTLIRGMGAATVALPFLRLLSRPARAAAPRRLIIMATPNGTVMDKFFPTSATYPAILAPLQKWQRKILVMRGIDMETCYKGTTPRDHLPDFPNALTGMQSTSDGKIQGISIDQELAKTVGKSTRFASLYLGVAANAGYPLIASGANQPLGPENNPVKVYTQLFSDLQSTADPDKLKLHQQRMSMLDVLKDELADVRCQLGGEERQKFDAHLTALSELERSLNFEAPQGGAGAPACTVHAVPPAGGDYPTLGMRQMDNMVAALACDLTRIAVLQWSQGASRVSHNWADAIGSHHGISHGSEGVVATEAKRIEWLVKIETWYAKQFAYLLGKLDAIVESDGTTMLDNSAVLWMHEQSNGGTHARRDMPYVLAGSCGGFFNTGRAVNGNKTAHNNLLISLAHAMGVPLKTFGDAAYCKGPLSILV